MSYWLRVKNAKPTFTRCNIIENKINKSSLILFDIQLSCEKTFSYISGRFVAIYWVIHLSCHVANRNIERVKIPLEDNWVLNTVIMLIAGRELKCKHRLIRHIFDIVSNSVFFGIFGAINTAFNPLFSNFELLFVSVEVFKGTWNNIKLFNKLRSILNVNLNHVDV